MRHEIYIWAENQIHLMKVQDLENSSKSSTKTVYFKKRPVEGHPWLIGGELRIRQQNTV